MIRREEGAQCLRQQIVQKPINRFQYMGGGWLSGAQPGAFSNDNHWTHTPNDYYTVSFEGTQIQIFGCKAPNGGIFAASIDGGAETMVDQYAASRSDDLLLYASPALQSGRHTLKVRCTGTKNASASESYISADRVDIIFK